MLKLGKMIRCESNPCSGGWPYLNSRVWELEGNPRFTANASWYSGFDIEDPLLSVWVKDTQSGKHYSLEIEPLCIQTLDSDIEWQMGKNEESIHYWMIDCDHPDM